MPSLDTMRPMTRSLCIAKNDFDGFAVRHGPGVTVLLYIGLHRSVVRHPMYRLKFREWEIHN